MEKMTFERSIAEMTVVNPFQTIATFIFADDKPNINNQALPFSEFERVSQSAIGMPVKMRFTGYGTGNHEGSIPIGVIQQMEIVTISDTHHQLVAKAALWNDEFPEEIEWLKKAFAEGRAPGISYEINFSDFDRKDGVQWIKDTYTGAATFVKTPAYGTRTALIALASTLDKTALEEGIIALAEQLNKSPEGGNQMDEKEIEALKAEKEQFKAEAATKQSEIEALTAQIAEKDSAVEALRTENESLKNAALLDSRLRMYTEAGFTLEAEAEKQEKKKTLFASLTDDQFEQYLEDLKAVKPAPATPPAGGIALASRKSDVPRFEISEDETITSLRNGMRALARPNSLD